MIRRQFLAASAAALALPALARSEKSSVLKYVPIGDMPTFGPDLVIECRDAQSWLHGFRHSVRPGWRGARLCGKAANGGRPYRRERRQDVDADLARWAGWSGDLLECPTAGMNWARRNQRFLRVLYHADIR
jgi:hypothetical protein